MSITVHIAYVLWMLTGLTCFYNLAPRKAVLITVISGSLFLPNVGYNIYALHNKETMMSAGVLICSLIFHGQIWSQLRLRLVDLPMLVWCYVSPFASSMSMSLGTYDALSAIVYNLLVWGVPYLLGRLYFGSVTGLRELGIGLLVAGLVYLPFCLWEIRMSPHLHQQLYGFRQHDFAQHFRFGGWRPMVFKQHGLAVSLLMGAATLQAIWLWRSRGLKQLWGVPIGLIALALLATTVMCKSVNGVVLVLLGTAVFFINKYLKIALPILFLVAAPPLYMYLRSTGDFSGAALISFGEAINEDKGGSVRFRITNENILIEKALERRILGWSRWGGNRVTDKSGKDISTTDGFWIITLGTSGIFGLAAVTAFLLLPVLVLLRRCPVRYWAHPKIAPAGVLAVVVALYMIDNLLNSMYDPIFAVAVGALTGLTRQSVVRALKSSLAGVPRTARPPALVPQVVARAPS